MTQEEWTKHYFNEKEKGWKWLAWEHVCGCCAHSGRCPSYGNSCHNNFKLASYEEVLSRLNNLDYSSRRWEKEIAEMTRLVTGENA